MFCDHKEIYTLRLSKSGGVRHRDSSCSRTDCTLRGTHRSSAYPDVEILWVYEYRLTLFFKLQQDMTLLSC